jgi:hypothetical protein
MDGQLWEEANVPENVLVVNYANNIKWIGNQVVILGNLATSSGNVSLQSTDGIHYGLSKPDTTKHLVDIETNTEFRNTIQFPHSVLLALGSSSAANTNTIAYSLDNGTSWIPSISSIGIFSGVANEAIWNGRIWVAVGASNGNTNTIATSVDGAEWTGRGNTIFSDEATGVEWATEILTKSPQSIRMLKYAFNAVDDGMVGQQVFAGEATRLAYGTDEAAEGRDAFLQKRDPNWSEFPWHF